MPDEEALTRTRTGRASSQSQALERKTVSDSRDFDDSQSAGDASSVDAAGEARLESDPNASTPGAAAGPGWPSGGQGGPSSWDVPPPLNSSDPSRNVPENPVYGALDLGTNNCRLLLARPTRRGFRVIDAFSRIIRLGEGVAQSGRLSDAAMKRTFDALRVCAGKIERNGVHRAQLVATEACRIAENGEDFLYRVRDTLGLDIEILTPETEARLAVAGCAALVDSRCDYVLVFDIGGGSSELIWLDISRMPGRSARGLDRLDAQACMAAWTSLPVGVVTLAEHFGGEFVTESIFEAMVDYVLKMLEPFEREHRFGERIASRSTHFLGTSGTVTTVAGIQLGLPRYDRNKVDGCWLSVGEAQDVTYKLVGQTYEERIAQPCIGRDRADLVLAGCAILEALIRMWPCERMRVADRGLREGILATLMIEDGVYRARRRQSRRRQ
ncbi:MAG: Ppx/GppA family phosphatase [Alphaproteobacteria bacterium]|nr:Ppx/GppA family phosphatase [Alphaproteobacteria bacterium]